MRPLILLIALAASAAPAADRSSAARAAFQRLNPCPSTGSPRGPCPGFVVDHVQPLCSGGEDAPGNMQWQSAPEAKAKDREERRACRLRRSDRPTP